MKTQNLIDKHVNPTCVIDALVLCRELEDQLERKTEESQKLFSLLYRLANMALDKGWDIEDLKEECKAVLGLFFVPKEE